MSMLPLLAVALLVWGGILVFLVTVDRKVSGLERKLDDLRSRTGGGSGGATAKSGVEEARR